MLRGLTRFDKSWHKSKKLVRLPRRIDWLEERSTDREVCSHWRGKQVWRKKERYFEKLSETFFVREWGTWGSLQFAPRGPRRVKWMERRFKPYVTPAIEQQLYLCRKKKKKKPFVTAGTGTSPPITVVDLVTVKGLSAHLDPCARPPYARAGVRP